MTSETVNWRIPTFAKHDRMAKAREEAGISQEHMGELLGCSRRTIVRYESGAKIPRSVVLGYHVATSTDLGWLETGIPSKGGGGLPGLDSNQEPIVSWIDEWRVERELVAA